MDDAATILRFAADKFDAGQGVALVTLVEIRGGAARPLGAQMAVTEDGLYCGFVSGGCTEAAVAREAMAAILSGNDRFLKLGEGSRFFDIVLPCGGGITLAIHVLCDTSSLRKVIASLEQRTSVSLRYDPARQSLDCVLDLANTGWSGDLFGRAFRPRTRVLLFGRSIELETTASLARAAAYDVYTNVAGDPDIIGRLADSNSAIALLYHDLDREAHVLEAALAAKPFYIGALGSSKTHDRRKLALRQRGYGDQEIARIKAPIGLFPKARDANSLAISVIADIAAIHCPQRNS
ncbi:XdhC family protein [Ochrobactrum sp. 19YEA23]|uniref:XdhC family protein n=1 Tax=Ochrobactrum sp. 19YEA23 TaxID=3039854 RepID=UPI00247AB5C4